MAGGSDTQSGVSALGGLTGVGAVEAVSVAVADGVAFVGFAVAFVAVGEGWTLPGVTVIAGLGSAGVASPPPWLASMPAVKVASPIAPDTTQAVVTRDPVISPPLHSG
jgi:hypothetical protein